MEDNTKENERKYVFKECVSNTKTVDPLTGVTSKAEKESDTALRIILGEES